MENIQVPGLVFVFAEDRCQTQRQQWRAIWLAVAGAVLLSLAPSIAATQAVDPADTCGGKKAGSACWLELQSHPGCYVWNGDLAEGESATWTGSCAGGKAEGQGTLMFSWAAGLELAEGQLAYGKRHGRWVLEDAERVVKEGSYANGIAMGRWEVRWPDGDVAEGLMANGERAGKWVHRESSGYMRETPYMDGKKHGTEFLRYSDGTMVRETPFVNGKEHGTAFYHYGDGYMQETPYVDGKKHGLQIHHLAEGGVTETPYVNGKEHGTAVYRRADGVVEETIPYVNGERHGTMVDLVANDPRGDRAARETPYVNGKKHGTEVWRYPDGRVEKTEWVNGERQD